MIKNCGCEDFPCCGHGEPDYTEPPYCDVCGIYGHYDVDCPGWDEDEEE